MSSVQAISATPVAQPPALQVQTVPGVWQAVPSSSSLDDQPATIICGSHITVDLPTPPTAASTRSTHPSQPLPEQEDKYDAVDAFFGVTRSTRSICVGGTRDSRHDDVPPPYPYNNNDLPAYSSWGEDTGPKEPPTLAMYLFKYGFLFPLFWIIGSIILLTPLRAPEDWEPTKTTEERAELVALMRKTEVKWARRCLIASLALVLLVLMLALITWRILRP